MSTSRSTLRGSHFGKLSWLLPLSIVLHIALIAWPHPGSGSGGAGDLRPAARGARLNVTLTDASARGTSTAARSAARPQGQGTRRNAPENGERATPAPDPHAAASFALQPPTVYYASDELSTKPVAQGEPALDPAELSTLVASGEVALTLWIDERGEVVELAVERSDLPGAFVQAATTAFRALRFAAGEIDGRKVGSVLHVEVRYDDERLASE